MFLEENERKAGSARCANSVREPRNMKRPFVFRAIILPELAFCISVCKTSHYILPYLRGAQISACSPCCPVLPRAPDLSASGTIQVGLVLRTGVC